MEELRKERLIRRVSFLMIGILLSRNSSYRQGQQLVRYDKEISKPISKILEQKILKFIKDNIQNWDAIVISDYAKGLFNEFWRKILLLLSGSIKADCIRSKFKNFL